jgi:hypothetical protein
MLFLPLSRSLQAKSVPKHVTFIYKYLIKFIKGAVPPPPADPGSAYLSLGVWPWLLKRQNINAPWLPGLGWVEKITITHANVLKACYLPGTIKNLVFDAGPSSSLLHDQTTLAPEAKT